MFQIVPLEEKILNKKAKTVPKGQFPLAHRRACNDLPCTTIDSLLPNYNLATIIEQFTTHNHGSFDHTRYLNSLLQPLRLP